MKGSQVGNRILVIPQESCGSTCHRRGSAWQPEEERIVTLREETALKQLILYHYPLSLLWTPFPSQYLRLLCNFQDDHATLKLQSRTRWQKRKRLHVECGKFVPFMLRITIVVMTVNMRIRAKAMSANISMFSTHPWWRYAIHMRSRGT